MNDLYQPSNFKKIERRKITGEGQLQSQSAKILFGWWSDFSPTMPMRRDFDIINMPSIASDIYLIEVLSAGNYRYRLSGEQVATLIGRRYHMAEFSTNSEDTADAMFAKYISWTISVGGVNGCIGSLEFFGKGHIDFESIDCPLIDEIGNTTHIIGVLCELKNR